ncbi:MAG: hypothetical protein GY762_04860 [Proteobacteria bacterium]|nr:hypothetical protein [Pseudomonadota bacterium]
MTTDSKMEPRRRAVEAMYGRIPDRVPCVPLIDNSYSAPQMGLPVSQCFLDPTSHAESLVACLERHPTIDGVSINLCLADEVILEKQEQADGYVIKTTGGTTWMIPYNDVGSVLERQIVSFDDPRLEFEDPLKPGILRTLQAIPSDIRRHYLINAGVTGPFSQVCFLMGIERVMVATIDDPAGLHRAIEKRLPLALQWIEEMAELDPGCIWIGEGFASSSLISPKTYKEFVVPYERALTEKIRQVDLPSVLHICGKLNPSLDLIPETQTNCLEADWQVDFAEAKGRIGGRVSLKGNLNTTTLVSGGPEDIYEMSKQAIEAAAAKGGFILSSGCALGRDTPPENVEAMAQAALDYGQYS